MLVPLPFPLISASSSVVYFNSHLVLFCSSPSTPPTPPPPLPLLLPLHSPYSSPCSSPCSSPPLPLLLPLHSPYSSPSTPLTPPLHSPYSSPSTPPAPPLYSNPPLAVWRKERTATSTVRCASPTTRRSLLSCKSWTLRPISTKNFTDRWVGDLGAGLTVSVTHPFFV